MADGDFDVEGAVKAGYSKEEIAGYVSDKNTPRMSQAFVDRIEKGNALTRVFKAAGEGANEGYGQSPTGIDNDSEIGKFLDKHVFQGPLRAFNEATMRPAAALVDSILRAPGAVIGSVGALSGQLAKEMGSDESSGNRVKREVNEMGQYLLIQQGMNMKSPVSRTVRGPLGTIHEEPVGNFPTPADFHGAANVLTDGEGNANVAANLVKQYDKEGTHPAEVVADTATDVVQRQEALGRETAREVAKVEKPEAPDELIPGVPAHTEPPKGGGNKPPVEPPTGSGEVGDVAEPGRNPEAKPNIKAAEDRVLEKVSVGEPSKTPSTADVYTATVDKFFPIKQAVDNAKDLGVDVNVQTDPYVQARLFAGWVGKAEVALKYDGPMDFATYKTVGPSLKDIIAPVKDQIQSWRAFLVAARAAEIENVKGLNSGIPMDAARTVVENAPKSYKQAMLALVEYQGHEAAYLRDAGVLSRAGYEGMREANKLYVPFHRIFDEEGLGISPTGSSLQAKNPIMRMKGSSSDIIDPLETVIKNTFLLKAMSERNVVGTKLVDMLLATDQEAGALVRQPGRDVVVADGAEAPKQLSPPKSSIVKADSEAPGEIDASVYRTLREAGMQNVQPELVDTIVDAAKPVAENEIRIFRDGRPERYLVDPALARAFKGLDRDTSSFLEKILTPMASTLRAGAVLSPEFSIRHLIRDTTYAFMTWSHEGNFTPADTFRGIVGLWVKDKDFNNWQKGGGGQVSMVSMDRRYLQENLRELTSETGLMTRAQNVLFHPLSPLQALTEIATSATHLGAFKKRMRQIDPNGVLDHEGPTNDGTIAPPSGRGGSFDAPRLGRIDTANLPAEWKNQMQLRDGVSTAEGLKSFGYNIEDGTFKDISGRPSAEKQAIHDAAWTSRDTAVDMHRMGANMHGVNAISAFANAKIQDTDRIGRLIVANPTNAAIMISVGIVAPSIAIWAYNNGDSRVQELPSWQRDSFWIIPTDKWEPATPQQAVNREPDMVRMINGQLHANNGAILRIPKPFNAGVLFGSGTERLLESWAKANPEAFKGYAHSLLENTVGDLLPSTLAPALEQATNSSRLAGRKIIPGNLEHLLPEYQYTPYTSELAKKLGSLASSVPGMYSAQHADSGAVRGVARALSSPELIENYVRGWTGTLGTYALQAADKGLQAAGILDTKTHPTSQLSDIPIIRAFTIRHPTGATDTIETFLSEQTRMKELADTFTRKAQVGDTDAMQHVQDLGGPGIFAKLNEFSKAISIHTDLINKVYDNPKIPPDEKRQLIDGYYYAMQRIAKTGRGIQKQLDSQGDEK